MHLGFQKMDEFQEREIKRPFTLSLPPSSPPFRFISGSVMISRAVQLIQMFSAYGSTAEVFQEVLVNLEIEDKFEEHVQEVGELWTTWLTLEGHIKKTLQTIKVGRKAGSGRTWQGIDWTPR